MVLTETALDGIATRLDSWVRFGTPAPAEGDVTALLTEVRLMRRVHQTDVALLNTCRDDLARVYDEYRDLAEQLGAIDEQDAAEQADPRPEDHWRGAREAPPDRFPGDAWDPAESEAR